MTRRPRRPTRRPHDDRGDVSIAAAGLVPVLILAIGLVVDGGGKLQADSRARYAAERAARAAGQHLDITTLQTSGRAAVDLASATAAAQGAITDAGADGTVEVAGSSHLVVRTTTTYDTTFLPLIGVRELTGTATAEVRLARDITQEVP